MQNQPFSIHRSFVSLLLAIMLCLGTSAAMADGVMPVMPPPPDVPLYWQLSQVEETPEIGSSGGLSAHHEGTGLAADLSDALLAESLLGGDDAAQGITLVVSRDDAPTLEDQYLWTPLPVYLEPDTEYTVEVSGTQTTGTGDVQSQLSIYVQNELVDRISAGGYKDEPTSTSFVISSEAGIYEDGRIVVTFLLRDTKGLSTDMLVYTYEMHAGVRPVPTPTPGFAPVALPDDIEIPLYYEAVPNAEGLFAIVTAPDEYRAYGSMSGGTPAFFPADRKGNVEIDAAPVTPDADFKAHVQGFVAEEADTPPAYYALGDDGLYTFTTREGTQERRVYGRINGAAPAFYPVDAAGVVDIDATPVDPAAEYDALVEGFGAAKPEKAVSHYTVTDKGVYMFEGRDGEPRYRVYGRLDGGEAGFYESDAEGALPEGAKQIDPQDDFDSYIKGFDRRMPDELPAHYEEIGESLYVVEGSEEAPAYRVYGIKDGQDPAFYPADAEGMLLDEAKALPVDPADDFEQYIAGFAPLAPETSPKYYEETEVPGVWAFFDKEGEPQYRAYGSLNREAPAFYPSDALGEVEAGALPVEPAADLALMPSPEFTPKEPDAVPDQYSAVQDQDGVYSFTGKDGRTEYRVFGAFGGNSPGFYPSDEAGTPDPASDAIDPEAEYDANFGSFTPETPEAVPVRYTIVPKAEGLYSFEDTGRNTVYRIYGSMDGDTPAFYPATAEGKPTSGAAADPEEDIARMPIVVSSTVVPRATEETAERQSVYRISDDGASRWYDPDALRPAHYTATVLPAATATEAAAGVQRMITSAPEATAEDLPTQLEATQLPQVEMPTATIQASPSAQSSAVSNVVASVTSTDASTQAAERTQAATRTPAAATPTATQAETEAPAIAETPAQTEAATATATSEQTVSPSAEPTEDAAAETSQGSATPWIIGGGAGLLAIIGAVLFARSRRRG